MRMIRVTGVGESGGLAQEIAHLAVKYIQKKTGRSVKLKEVKLPGVDGQVGTGTAPQIYEITV